MSKAKCSLITTFLGETHDRFHAYNEPRNLEEKYKLVSEMEGIDGIESVFPYEVSDPVETKRLADKYGLTFSAINVNVKGEPQFRDGGLSSLDAKVRDEAIQYIKNAKDFAEAVGADKVTCCPLSDGYEFNFQCDYGQRWAFLVDSFKKAGQYKPNIPLYVEYKPSETRGHCFIDTAAKALLLLSEINIDGMGVTLDFGHSTYGNENPAEAVSLLSASPYPYYIHINDNDAKWDWDYMVGTKNYLSYVEFLYIIKKDGYKGYLTSDTSPTRWDMKKTFEMNARVTNKIFDVFDRIDEKKLDELIHSDDYMATWMFIEEEILSLK